MFGSGHSTLGMKVHFWEKEWPRHSLMPINIAWWNRQIRARKEWIVEGVGMAVIGTPELLVVILSTLIGAMISWVFALHVPFTKRFTVSLASCGKLTSTGFRILLGNFHMS